MDHLLSPAAAYRATGVILSKLTEAYYGQLDLFGETIRMQRLSNLGGVLNVEINHLCKLTSLCFKKGKMPRLSRHLHF
jgi:hypothetical protein